MTSPGDKFDEWYREEGWLSPKEAQALRNVAEAARRANLLLAGERFYVQKALNPVRRALARLEEQ